MTKAIQVPRLLRSPLTGQVYIVTRYHFDEARGRALVADRKYDVTAEFEALVSARMNEHPPCFVCGESFEAICDERPDGIATAIHSLDSHGCDRHHHYEYGKPFTMPTTGASASAPQPIEDPKAGHS